MAFDATTWRRVPGFRLEHHVIGDDVVIRVSGEVDRLDQEAFEAALHTRVDEVRDRYRLVVVDLTGLTFLCAHGFRALLALQERNDDPDGLLLCAPAGHVVTHVASLALPELRLHRLTAGELLASPPGDDVAPAS